MDVEIKKKNVALNSVFASFILMIIKLVVGLLTGSIGILSEAAHSALDLAAAFITYLAVRISGQPADLDHHFGHGKVESVSALIETGLLLLTSVWIVYEAVNRLISKSVEIQVTWYAFAVMGISVIVDYSRSRALHRIAKETKSQALEADALHFQSDIYSSLVVILGLIMVSLGTKGADAIAAIGVALLVVVASYRLGKRTIDVLMDTAPTGLTEEVEQIVKKVEGVVLIDRLRVRPAGDSIYVDMMVSVDRDAPLEQVHKITKNIEDAVKKQIKDADLVVHVKPVALKGETLVDRIQTIAKNHGVSAHNVYVYEVDKRKYINFDIEVESDIPLEIAHKKASHLEQTIQNELGHNVNINTHIEPVMPKKIVPKNVSKEDLAKIYKLAAEVKKSFKQVKDIHEINAHNINKRIFISLHFRLNKKLHVDEVHDLSTKIEVLFREKIPNVEKVFVHPEPFEK